MISISAAIVAETPSPAAKSTPNSPGVAEVYAVATTAANIVASTAPPTPPIANSPPPLPSVKATPGLPGLYGVPDAVPTTTVGSYKDSSKFRNRLDDLKPPPSPGTCNGSFIY